MMRVTPGTLEPTVKRATPRVHAHSRKRISRRRQTMHAKTHGVNASHYDRETRPAPARM